MKKIIKGSCCLFLAAFLLMSLSCRSQPPLKVGYVGPLTGRNADLGIAGRNAAEFAIKEQNLAGGIQGRQVELIVMDDQDDEDVARQAVQGFIDANVVAVIGHTTSRILAELAPMINSSRVVMLNSFSSMDQLYGQDDYLLNFNLSASKSASTLVSHVLENPEIRTLSVFLDVRNSSLTANWLNVFRKEFEFQGGQVGSVVPFFSGGTGSFLDLAKKISSENPDAVLILANGLDTAMLTQQFHKIDFDPVLFAAPWSFTGDLLRYGGQTVEGVTTILNRDVWNRDHFCLAFQKQYTESYGMPPTYATGMAYDATRYLLAGLKQNSSPQGLRDTLLAMEDFAGLQSLLALDAFGDVRRPQFITTIRNSRFERWDEL